MTPTFSASPLSGVVDERAVITVVGEDAAITAGKSDTRHRILTLTDAGWTAAGYLLAPRPVYALLVALPVHEDQKTLETMKNEAVRSGQPGENRGERAGLVGRGPFEIAPVTAPLPVSTPKDA